MGHAAMAKSRLTFVFADAKVRAAMRRIGISSLQIGTIICIVAIGIHHATLFFLGCGLGCIATYLALFGQFRSL